MHIERIFISPARSTPQVDCERITLQANKGVIGDRNFELNIHPGQNLTLVEAEEIERFFAEQGLSPDLSATRRNLVTRGVRLNSLVGVEYSVGAVRLRGVELCEPCTILGDALLSAGLDRAAVIKRWVGRGGLRVDVLSDGAIQCGDALQTECFESPRRTEG